MSLMRGNVTKQQLLQSRVGTVVKSLDSSKTDVSIKLSRQFIGDSFDQYLASIGLVKKVMPNNNGSSIYRAVCESLSMDQSEHKALQDFVEGELLFQYRLQRIRTGLPSVNKIEDTLKTLARLLGIELHVYRVVGEEPVIYNGICAVDKPVEKVMLCEANRGHYDLVITREDHINLAYSQSFVYDLLYFHVFGFSRDVINECIERVRNDMESTSTIDMNTHSCVSIQQRRGEAFILRNGGYDRRRRPLWSPPMPYSAIKSLDPSVYRNIAYDLYSKERKRELVSIGRLYASISHGMENGLPITSTVLCAPESIPQNIVANEEEREIQISEAVVPFTNPGDNSVLASTAGADFSTVHLPGPSANCSSGTPLFFQCAYIECFRFKYGNAILAPSFGTNSNFALGEAQQHAQPQFGSTNEHIIFGPPLQLPAYHQQNYMASTVYYRGGNLP